jgi:imidazolonepropionase-like amidohydrolase
LTGKVVTPGLFGGLNTAGVDEVPGEAATVDSSLRLGKMYPEFDLSLAFNPDSNTVEVGRADGIAFAVLAPSARAGAAGQPGGSIVAGLGSVVSLAEKMARPPSIMVVDLGSGADALSGGSRAGQYMLLKRALAEARAPRPAAGSDDLVLSAAGHDTLAAFLKQKRPFVFEVDRAADIRQLIAFAKREGIRAYVQGGTEAWQVADELKRAGIPVILNPFEDLPETFDQIGATLQNAARLHQAGVTIAFSLESNSHRMRRIRQAAGVAVANGLPWNVALDAITRTPAQLFGVGSEFGSIEPGHAANLVVWSGDPLEVTTLPEKMWLNGQLQTLRSRQTELRDRYLERSKQNVVH